MAGTDGAEFPFWSADSRSIGFFSANKLYRIDISGGPPQPLANFANGRGGAWNAEGVILFGGATPSPIWRVAASGGEPAALTRVDPPRQTNHRFPQFLPDGRHFLFHGQGTPETSGIYLGSLDGSEPKRLTPSDTFGAYLWPDRLVFMREGALITRRLDIARGELTGDPVTLADPVGYDATFLLGGFSVSGGGRIAYRAGGAGRRQLTWFDRTGKRLGVAHEQDAGNVLGPELSPDGRRVAVQRTTQNNQDVWLMDLARGGSVRFTVDVSNDGFPVWSPEGTRIAFASARKGPYNLYLKPSSGVGAEELLRETASAKIPQDWSKDGRFLLYYEIDPKTNRDLWALEMTGNERKTRVVANTPSEERLAQFSSDGRFVAYETNESGQFEIVVQPFPEPTGKWQVSTGGGTQPRWRADGKELYFIAPDGKLMAASVTTGQNQDSPFDAGRPVALFPIQSVPIGGSIQRPQYAVSRDGRFLINQPVEEPTASPITLILNWRP
ncbi:MAG: PD40 domain-containing protein [Acidobacteria bacterium]|nr:PD40 domain-containing protein [Acidobacteriota bacterium]